MTLTLFKEPARGIVLVILLCAVALWIIQIGDYLNGTVDDVFITLRVTNNVVHDHGFVYNIGENIEGHSNWSWVALLALGSRLSGIDSSSMDMLWLAKGLAFFFSLLACVSVWKLTHRFTASSVAASLSILFLAASTPFGFWSICGLETPLMLWLVTSAAVQAIDMQSSSTVHRSIFLGLTLAAIAVTRPEGAGYGVVLLLALWWLGDRRLDGKLLIAAVAFVLPVAVFIAWRYLTYGMLVPNTFYAKIIGGARRFIFGFKYAFESFAGAFAPLILLLPFAFLKEDTENLRRSKIVVLALTGFGYFFVIYSSGDWMPAYRFALPVLGIVIALALYGFVRLLGKTGFAMRSTLATAVIAACIVAAIAVTLEGRVRTKAQIPLTHAVSDARGHGLYSHVAVAEWLRARPGIELFAAGEAGVLGFLNPEKKLLDLNGLMDTAIARRRKEIVIDPKYVLSRKPQSIIIMQKDKREMIVDRPSTYSEIINADPEFHARYELDTTFENFVVYLRRK